MSEHWKSTPKYWCKHCKTYIRDTKLEKQNHEATPKHQGNLKRFLRDLHRGNERDEREKQKAKDEVARLNGIHSSTPYERGTGTNSRHGPAISPIVGPIPQQASLAERKQQMAKLAELGISIPEEYRREIAMAGEWQTTAQRLIYDEIKKEGEEKDSKSNGMNVGLHKRKLEWQEEEEQSGGSMINRGWGSTMRSYPGDEMDDLEKLLGSTSGLIKTDGQEIRATQTSSGTDQTAAQGTERSNPQAPQLKKEEFSEEAACTTQIEGIDGPVKLEDETAQDTIMFKKRKTKFTTRK